MELGWSHRRQRMKIMVLSSVARGMQGGGGGYFDTETVLLCSSKHPAVPSGHLCRVWQSQAAHPGQLSRTSESLAMHQGRLCRAWDYPAMRPGRSLRASESQAVPPGRLCRAWDFRAVHPGQFCKIVGFKTFCRGLLSKAILEFQVPGLGQRCKALGQAWSLACWLPCL